MKSLICYFLIPLSWRLITAIPNCCSEGHLLTNKKICDNNKNVSLTCGLRYFINKTNENSYMYVNEDQDLVFDDGDYVTPDK